MNKNILKLRIVLWLILLWSVAGFLYMGIIPSGSIKYKYDFSKKSSFISHLTPDTRVNTIAKEFPNVIIGNPVYITLSTPRKFNEAVFNIKYKRINERNTVVQYPVIEAGVLVDNTVWRYDLKPLENEIIDKLALVWDTKRSGDLLLLQRNDNTASSVNKIYDSVESFLEDLPSNEKIALYNYDLKQDFVLENYRSYAVEELLDEKEKSFTEIEQDLRGAYQFYTYIKNEDLDFVFTLSDLNQNKDKDDIDVYFYYDNHLIASSHLDDDGIETDNSSESKARELELKLPGLPEGIYKIELKVNDDIVTRKIKTKQRKISFINRLWLEQNTESEKFSLYTDSNVIQANTTYANGLQTILAGMSELKLEDTYKQYSVEIQKKDILDSYSEIILEKNGVILSGNRVFSFSPENFFDPNIKKLDKYIDIAQDGVKYILANYATPFSQDEWRQTSVRFDLSKAYREKGKYSFLISIPGLTSPESIDQDSFGIEIDSLEFELKGRSLNEKINEFLKNKNKGNENN